MAHHSRWHYVRELIQRVGDVPISWDKNHNRWETGKNAWLLYNKNCRYHVVLQDDAIVCDGFYKGLLNAVNVVEDRPISLFARNKKRHNGLIDQCKREGVRWLVLNRLNWGVGILLPTEMIKPMVRWIDNNTHIPNYDMKIALFFLHKNIPVWYTMPSLVDHRIDGVSLATRGFETKGSQINRYARYYIGQQSATEIDWNTPAIYEERSINSYYRKLKQRDSKYIR